MRIPSEHFSNIPVFALNMNPEKGREEADAEYLNQRRRNSSSSRHETFYRSGNIGTVSGKVNSDDEDEKDANGFLNVFQEKKRVGRFVKIFA